MRLIDADELLKKQTTMTEYDEGGWDWPVSVVLVEDIKNAPAIDPKDLRPSGRWIVKRDMLDTRGLLGVRCSVCGQYWALVEDDAEQYINYFNFCPKCGAKMEEEKE